MDKPTPPVPQPHWDIDDDKRVHTHDVLLKHGEAMAAWGAAQERARMQARIDALMLEYCPDEMSEEQKRNWAAHQVSAAQQGD